MIVTHENKGRVPPRLSPSDAMRFVPEVKALVEAANDVLDHLPSITDGCDCTGCERTHALNRALAAFQ